MVNSTHILCVTWSIFLYNSAGHIGGSNKRKTLNYNLEVLSNHPFAQHEFGMMDSQKILQGYVI